MQRFAFVIVGLALAAAAPAFAQTTMAPSTGKPPASVMQPSGRAAAGMFKSEADAQKSCGSGNVVWGNMESHIYHYSGSSAYGHTKKGAFMCQNTAESQGFRAAKNETPPAGQTSGAGSTKKP
jgi:hypothetical protein